MALVPFNKRGEGGLGRLHHDIEDLFNDFLRSWDAPLGVRKIWPAIDIADNENAVVVKAEVPGCQADDIDISVRGDVLTISGEKKQKEERKEKGYYHSERYYGSFRRDLHLPDDVDPEKVEAECKNGVLTITLPKAETAKPVKVKVKG